MRINRGGRSSHQLTLVEDSPLRSADPRTKLFLSLAISIVVMTSIERLLIFLGVYLLFLIWARLLAPTVQHIWRERPPRLILISQPLLLFDVGTSWAM